MYKQYPLILVLFDFVSNPGFLASVSLEVA